MRPEVAMERNLHFLTFMGHMGFAMTMEQRCALASMQIAEAEMHLRSCAAGMCPESIAIFLANSALRDAVRTLSVL